MSNLVESTGRRLAREMVVVDSSDAISYGESRALEAAASALLVEAGYGAMRDPSIGEVITAPIFADSRVADEDIDVRPSGSFHISYIDAVDLVEGLSSADGVEAIALAKAARAARVRASLGADFSSRRSASRAEARADDDATYFAHLASLEA